MSVKVKVKVISWNILASEWITKEDYPDIKQTELFNSKKRIKTIIDKLKTYNADIMLLQEVMPDAYKVINNFFKDKYYITEIQPIKWSYTNNENTNGKSGNVTLFRLSKYTPIQINIDTQSNKYINITNFCIITQCTNNETNKKITLYNIHLDYESCVKRNKQMSQILDFDNNNNNNKNPCIIAGDFNQVYRKNSKLYNIPKFLIHNFCNTYYIKNTNYIKKNINIDNILSRGFKIDKLLSKCANLSSENEDIFIKIGSDHIPIIANIIL